MRTTRLLCPLLFLIGPLATQQIHTQEADSPIDFFDANSIHFKRAQGFSGISPTKWKTQINGSRKRDLAMSCSPTGTCDAMLGKGRWVVTLYDMNNAMQAKLTHPGQDGANYVDIEGGKNISSTTATELVQSDAHLHHITVSVNNGPPTTYPSGSSTCSSPCTISIYRN